MTDPGLVPRPDLMLTAIGGGYLRNPVRTRGVTCADCVTPVDGYNRCFACKSQHSRTGLADATAFLTYAVAGQKSGLVMRGYKSSPPVAEHQQVVGLLLLVAVEGHTQCIEALAASALTHWAMVPSLPAKPYVHPLRGLIVGRAQGSEVPLVAATSVPQPRAVNPDHFTCNKRFIAELATRDYDPGICPWTGGRCPQ